MRKINVLNIITGLNPGGAEEMLLRTVQGVNKNKFRMVVVSFVGGMLKKEFEVLCSTQVLNIKSTLKFPLAVVKVHRLIKKYNVAVVHAYLFHANIVARFAAIGTSAKVISAIRIKQIEHPWHNWVDRFTRFLVDIYTTNSESVTKFMINVCRINNKKIVCIKNGLEIEKIDKISADHMLRKKLGIPQKAKVIISSANMRRQKDYPTLFKALTLLKNVHLIIIGGGPLQKEYELLAKSLGIDNRVHFLGFIRNFIEVTKAGDAGVLSTFYEGQPNAVLVYMATKKPVVTTSIPETRELVKNNFDGLLIPPRNPRKFAAGIKKVLTDKKFTEKLVNNAYKKVKKDHNITRVIKETEELYTKLCAE
ncbi:hypothetical protein COV18_02140 [Candidatus Woesearchaeota archaeon CG10_big_fil_rev_8_21_14_0_10_37_12]|nr:MAG: hypothetical protein COV18_02140 [Candidatus Woesearchaeota archaeon CG10_big_fil_rev_8_21_14_0_10_37_12]